MKTYEKILDGQQVSGLQKSTCDTLVMDIGGHRAPTKIAGQHLVAHATVAELEEVKKRGRAAALASGMLVEIPGETDDSLD